MHGPCRSGCIVYCTVGIPSSKQYINIPAQKGQYSESNNSLVTSYICDTIEVHHFFLNTTPQFGELKASPKNGLFGEK